MRYFYNPPSVIKKIFRDFYWETSSRQILLTFDDGPTAELTGPILKSLAVNKLKAVFFCVGNNIIKNPSLAEEIISEGHVIGNHTFNHKRLTEINNTESSGEIDSFNNLMKEKLNYEPRYFRPPHGRIKLSTGNILREKQMKCVMWSLLTQDYKNDFEVVKFAVKNYLNDNSIVVFHDNIKSKKILEDSLQYTIEQASARGYIFGEPAECLK